MQAVRPRVLLAPLHLGLGIQMHHHFGSKFLIDSLHAHGFCSSYATVLQYERNAAVAQGTDLPGHISDQFIQYVADNVDHNTRILDGKGTFHGRGIIATITPGGRISKLVRRIGCSRRNKYLSLQKSSGTHHTAVLQRVEGFENRRCLSKSRPYLEDDSWLVGVHANGL